jgi:octaprenyl-diphosphate synthase
MTFEDIKQPVKQDIELFESTFKKSMKTQVPLLDLITRYIVKRKGKQMRPLFVFLSAGMHAPTNEHTQRAAALIELLHTATLVHDDVVDDSNLRRGFFSINALWKNKAAVLVGDFLLSKGMLLALENKEYDLLEIVSYATKQMSEGELLQIEKARRLDIDESVYFDVIKMKTASLIASCCAAGAASVGASDDEVLLMRSFGENVGIAFQIRDDLFDFEKDNKTGKPVGGDIKEKKMTLPLIYTLNQMGVVERKKTILDIKYRSNKQTTIDKIISLVNTSGGIDYATKKMEDYLSKAINMLDGYPDSEYKKALIALVNYSINRNK